jgi:hypothetical protein
MENGRKYIQVALVIALVLALARTGYVIYQRRQIAAPAPNPKITTREMKSDDYVFVRSLHAYDVPSAKKLEGMTVWVKAGSAVAYFRPGDLDREAGLLPPTARLTVSRVATSGNQVMATFTFDDRNPKGPFLTPIGAVKGADTRLIVDSIFYYDDPHKLYGHWPPATWAAIDRNQVLEGMSEAQAAMALGRGQSPDGGSYGDRTMRYEHDGGVTEVTFRSDRAVRVEGKTSATNK